MNERDDIPADVRALLARHIDSVVQLELLLLLHGDATRAWTADEAARELRVELGWTVSQLELLVKRGLAHLVDAATHAYRFAGDVPIVARAVDQLAALYADRRVRIIALIYAEPSDTLRTFADAFRIRKEDGNDG